MVAISTLLVDDDHKFCHGLRELLNFYPSTEAIQLEILAQVHSLEGALAWIRQGKIDLILLDLHLGCDQEQGGLQVLHHLRELRHDAQVLVLSAHGEDHYIFQAMQGGAKGYVLKPHLGSQLFEAIATVLAGSIYLPPDMSNRFFRQFWTQNKYPIQVYPPVDLTDREQQILKGLVEGASNEAIAQTLFVSTATVKAHLTNIFRKLDVTNRTQAIVEVLKRGLIDL